MLSLVQYIIDAGNRLASTTEVMSGELPGQNTKTGAYQAAIDQGQKVFTAIYKRIRRSLEQELRKMYKLNGYILASGQDTLPARSAQVFGVTPELYQADLFYIQPSADPNIAIKEQQLAKDQQVIQTLAGFGLSQGIPEAIRRYFSTLEVENVESVLPANQQLPDPNAAAQAQAQIEAQDKEARFGLEKEKFEWQKLVDISESAHKADSTKVDLLKVDGSLQAKGLELGKSLVELRAKAEENDKQREVDNGAAQQGGVPSVEAGEDNQVVDGMGPGGGARDSQ
jgi:chaperonin GroES